MSVDLAVASARGGIVNLSAQVVGVVARTIAVVVLARLLPPDLFALVAIVIAINGFASAVIFFGLPMATVQATNLSRPAKSSLFYINSALGATLAVTLYFSAHGLAALYDDQRLVEIARWLALVPLLAGVQSQFRSHVIRNLRFTTLAVIEVVAVVLGSAIAIVMAANGWTYQAVVAQALAPVAVQAVLVMVLARWSPGLPGAGTEVRELVGVGMRIFGINLLRNGSRHIIVPVVGLAVPAAALGAFDRAQQLAIVPINATVDQLQRVAVPILSRLRSEPARMLAYLQRAQLVSAYLTATVFLIIAALGEPLIASLLGPQWTLAGEIIQVLALGSVFRSLAQTIQWLFISADATREGLRFSLWSQPAIAVLTILGLPWGVFGVAVANSIAWALCWPLATAFAARAAGFRAAALYREPLRAIFAFSLPVGAAAASARLFGLSDGATLGVGLVLTLLAAAVIAIVVQPVRNDLKLILQTLRLAGRGRGQLRTEGDEDE